MGYHVHCMEWNNRTAGMHGLEIAFPYLDCALIQFLMSIPGDIQSRDGVPRGLMRAAMRRIVPEVVVNRTCKGEFTQLANETIECDFRPISELLSPAALSVQFGYVDGAVLRDSLPDWRTTAYVRPATRSWRIDCWISADSNSSCADSLPWIRATRRPL